MVKKETIIFVAFAVTVLASEIEDSEQKKRGAAKTSTLNAIPTGSQKPDYTYNLYSQNSGQSSPSQTYQSQVQPSFYPNQAASIYYTSANNADVPATNPTHAQVPTQATNSHFVPINFIPSQGYQSKYQIVPQKQNVQLAIIQQPTIPSSSILQYPHSFFSPNPTNQINTLGQGHFGFTPNYQSLPVGGHYIGQPSMIVLPHSHPTLYNNLVYPNPTQSFYNYYPSLSQSKYSYPSGTVSSQEYEKVQSSVPQSTLKEDNGVGAQSSEYLSSDSNNYKNAYTRRSTYPKK